MKRTLALLLLGLLAACGSPAPSVEAEARRLESQVWSPYCPGRLLSDCTTRQADQLRERIETRLRSGESSEEVLAWLQANYGEEVLARAPSGRRGLAVWAVPVAVLLGGAALAGGLVLRWSRPAPPPPAAGAPAPPPAPADREAWIRRVREEVERDP